MTKTNLVERLRSRLVTVPKPGTEPRVMAPNEWMSMTVGGEHKAGDDAGEIMLPNFYGAAANRKQQHIYVVEPLCKEAAAEIERLRGELEHIAFHVYAPKHQPDTDPVECWKECYDDVVLRARSALEPHSDAG